MNVRYPIQAAIPGLHGPVLSVLAGTTGGLTGRAVARLIQPHASQSGVARVLDALVRQGLVIRTTVGPAGLYRLNRDHLAAPAIEQLADMRQELVRRLREFLRSRRPEPISAYLYGSAARGDGDEDSDIDILLVWLDEFGPGGSLSGDYHGELGHAIRVWTGNPPSLIDYSLTELRALPARGRELAETLVGDGIRLHGHTIEELTSRDSSR